MLVYSQNKRNRSTDANRSTRPGFSEGFKGSTTTRSFSKHNEIHPGPLPKNGKNGEHRGENENIYEGKLEIEKKERKQKGSNKIIQALTLPSICNINPCSVYNKKDEFETLVKEEDLDCIFMSESFEREEMTLDNLIKLDDHIVLSNVNQRKGKGGRPAIIANFKKFEIQNLTNNLIQIPWGVEAIWCILTPKNIKKDSKI